MKQDVELDAFLGVAGMSAQADPPIDTTQARAQREADLTRSPLAWSRARRTLVVGLERQTKSTRTSVA